MKSREYTTAIAVAVIVLALSGCAADVPHSAGPDPATTSASPTPTASASALAIDCASLTSDQAVSALLGVSASRADAGARAISDVTRTYSQLAAAGGASCLWGGPGADDVEKPSAVLTIDVLPKADGAWQRLAEWYPASAIPGADYSGHPSRGGDCTQNYCHTNILVGDVWIAAEASSPQRATISETDFHTLMQNAVDVIAPIAGSATGVVPNAPHPACTDDAYAAAAATSFGVPVASFVAPENIFRIEAAVGLVPGAEFCPYQPSADGSGGVLVNLTVIPGGAEAFTHYRRHLAEAGVAVSDVSFASGGQTHAAIQRTVPGVEWATTTVDVLSGTDWLSVASTNVDRDPAPGTVAFAQWVVEHR